MEPGGAGRSRASITNRWTVAAAAVIMQSGFGSLYAWSVFRQPLSAHYGTGITTVNVTFFISGLVFAISTFGAGFLLRRVGPPRRRRRWGIALRYRGLPERLRRGKPPAPLRHVRPRGRRRRRGGAHSTHRGAPGVVPGEARARLQPGPGRLRRRHGDQRPPHLVPPLGDRRSVPDLRRPGALLRGPDRRGRVGRQAPP